MLGGAKYRFFDTLDRTARLSRARAHDAMVVGDRHQDFGTLRDRALRLANALIGLGVAPGTRVGVLMGNRLEWPEALFAIAAAGGVCVPINVLLRGFEVGYVIEDSDVAVLIVDSRGEAALAELPVMPSTVIIVGDVEVPAGISRLLRYEDVVEGG